MLKPAEVRAAQDGLSGLASWYDLPGRQMANGRVFDPDAMNVAMLKVPLGTVVTVRLAEDPSRSIAVTVTDRGPYEPGRVVDLTPAAFTALVGNTRPGLAKVVVTLA
jgi:rare lipoprotein A